MSHNMDGLVAPSGSGRLSAFSSSTSSAPEYCFLPFVVTQLSRGEALSICTLLAALPVIWYIWRMAQDRAAGTDKAAPLDIQKRVFSSPRSENYGPYFHRPLSHALITYI